MQSIFSSWFSKMEDESSKSTKKVQLGENSHLEYSWNTEEISDIKSVSDDTTISSSNTSQLEIIREQLVQLNFQLIRYVNDSMIKNQIRTVLSNIYHLDKVNRITYLSFFYRLIGYTRDIIDGKGEYNLSYMCLLELYNFFPNLSMYGLSTFIIFPTNLCKSQNNDESEQEILHPYGSFKDLKYFSLYILKNTDEKKNHPLYKFCVKLMVDAIRKDNSLPHNSKISLAAKWIPRETSKFGYMFSDISELYFEEYFKYCKTPEQKKKASNKAKMQLRNIISSLNKKLDTMQIKQCSNNWSKINPNNITSITFKKQKKALLNKKNGKGTDEIRHENNVDRIQCAENITNYISKAKSGEVVLKGKRVSIADFVKEAIEYIKQNSPSQIDIDSLNMQWNDNASQNDSLGDMFPLIDVSDSMTEDDSLYYAVGLGLRIASKSRLGRRAMTFSSNPTLINLEEISEDNFVAQVQHTIKADWGGATNLYKVFELFLKTAKESGLTKEETGKMSIVILSDMQINLADNNSNNMDVLFNKIHKMYFDAGQYTPPHLVFWNLRATSGFPATNKDTRCSMLSGFSPAILNSFMNGDSLKDLPTVTPWSTLLDQLNNTRYDILLWKVREEEEISVDL